MRILACSLTYPLPNGVSSSINESIDGFRDHGHELRILSPDYGTGAARPEHYYVQASTIGKTFIHYIGKHERMFSWRSKPEIKRLIKDFRAQALWMHTVTWAPNGFEKVMLASKLPKVLTYHTMVELYGKIYFGTIGEQHMVRRSEELSNSVDHIITPSRYMATKLLDYGVKKPISVIPSGIEPISSGYTKKELAAKYNFAATNTVLIYVGRVVKEKNITGLLQMMKQLVKLRSEVTLLLIGPGEIDELKAEAESLGVGAQVIFTDQLPMEEARRCYKGSDLFVFASQSETQGLVIGEAMTAGIPVVALTSPIQPEVYPKEVAVVVKNKTEFARAVDGLLNNPSLYKELAIKGKAFVEKNFSKKQMIDKQIAVFEQLIH